MGCEICLGVNSVCLGGSVPARVLAGASEIFGANVVGAYFPEDVTTDPVSSHPGRVGNLLVSAGSKYVQSAINGRRALAPSAPGYYLLYGDCTGVIKTLITVAVTPALPFVHYAQLLRTGLSAAIVGDSGSSVLYNGGWTNYIDGVETRSLSPGVHSYAATKSDATTPSIWFGINTDYAWEAPSGFKLALGVVASAEQLLSFHTQVCRPCYRF